MEKGETERVGEMIIGKNRKREKEMKGERIQESTNIYRDGDS